MDEPVPSQRVEAMRSAIEAGSEFEVEADADGVTISCFVDELYDPETGEWSVVDDPHLIRIHIIEQDDEHWTTVLGTPVILSLGDLGRIDSAALGVGVYVTNVEGSAYLEVGGGDHPIDDPIEHVYETASWFIDFASQMASGGLTFAGFNLQSMEPPPRTPGFFELHQSGNDLTIDSPEQTAATERAIEIFTEAGLEEFRLRAVALSGLAAVSGFRATEALEIFKRCDAEFRELKLDAPDLEGQIAGNLGILLAGFFGRREEAATHLDRAEELGYPAEMLDLSRTGNTSITSGLFLKTQANIDRAHDDADSAALINAAVSNAFHHKRLGQWDEALIVLEQALEIAESDEPDSVFSVLVEICGVQMGNGDQTAAAATYERLKAEVGSVANANDMTQITLGMFGMMVGDPDSMKALEAAERSDLGALSAIGKLALDFQRTKNQPGSDPLRHLDEMIELSNATGDEILQGEIHSTLARFRLGRIGDAMDTDTAALAAAEQAIEDILIGIRSHDRARHRFDSALDRSAYLKQMLGPYEIALSVGCARQRHALVAELLERLRLNGSPDGSPDEQTAMLSVIEPKHTSIDGRSELASDESDTVELGDRIADQAGPGAWWWSAWQGTDRVVWALRSPMGELSSGMIELDDAVPGRSESLRELLDLLRADIPVGGGQDSATTGTRLTDGWLGGRYQSDGLANLRSLGRLIVPARLRAALVSTPPEQPVRLLCSLGPSLAWLPVGLLVIDRDPDVHLVERTVPQMMAQELEPAPRRPTIGHGVLAVIDPSDDLTAPMRTLDQLADRVVAGQGVLDDRGGDGALATESSILSHLADGDRFELLLYVGHAHSGNVTQPLSAGLKIGSQGAVLTVADLIDVATMLRPPSKAVLCACSTASSTTNPATERWGLPVAFLLAGCDQVVATRWDLVSCAATAAFIKSLLHNDADDLAMALRETQVEFLRRWQDDLVSNRLEFSQADDRFAHLFLWAAFTPSCRFGLCSAAHPPFTRGLVLLRSHSVTVRFAVRMSGG